MNWPTPIAGSAAAVRSQRAALGEAAGARDWGWRVKEIGFVLPKWRFRLYLVKDASINLHSSGDFGFVLPKVKFDCMLLVFQLDVAANRRARACVVQPFPCGSRRHAVRAITSRNF